MNAVFYSRYCGAEFPSDAARAASGSISSGRSLIIAIMSEPANGLRRNVIRATWGTWANEYDITALFVIGSAALTDAQSNELTIEKGTHNDVLILDDLVDAYANLTQKLVRAMARLRRDYEAAFFMKVDDDTFVDVKRLVTELARKPRERLYWGYFSNNARVKSSGQWAEHSYALCERYLPYARGGGYVITFDLLEYLVTNGGLLSKYRSEDVSLGTWLAPLDITRIHDKRFDTEATSRGCLNDYLVTHKQSIEDMEEKWRRLSRNQSLCATERRLREAYSYDWNQPPSKCCAFVA